MEILVILALIAWVVTSAASRSKRRRAEDARRQRVLREMERQAPAPSAAPQRPPATPLVQPTVRPATPSAAPQRPHVVQPSRATGHAHTESSMTGFEACPPGADRPLAERLDAFKAAKAPAKDAPRPAAPVGRETAPRPAVLPAQAPFRFDPAEVRNGLIYAEILGKPKALRHR